MERVKLVGLDFGTTTSSAVIAEAGLVRNHVTGRTELVELREHHRSEIVFTPFRADDGLDEAAIAALLDRWLGDAGAGPEEIAGGGAILTGLAARRGNAGELARQIRARVGGAVIAAADDPCFEAWLAFMGSAAGLSRARPAEPLLNLDVGGGTTNLALGLGGEVIATGALFVGARHVQVAPGTHRIERLSEQAARLFEHLGIVRGVGDTLAPAEVAAVLEVYVALLEAAVQGRAPGVDAAIAQLHEQVPFRMPAGTAPPALAFSGGVGELIYAHLGGAALPEPTRFGDLGVELARAIAGSAILSARLVTPASTGRATSYGLLRHATRLSGATLYLPRPQALPLSDLPIVARLSTASTDLEVRGALALARRSACGGCVVVSFAERTAAALKALAARLAGALGELPFPPERPLVLLVPDNLGKVLGGSITGWGSAPFELIVLDEVDPAGARFAQIGRLRDHVVPVSFHGLNPREDAP